MLARLLGRVVTGGVITGGVGRGVSEFATRETSTDHTVFSEVQPPTDELVVVEHRHLHSNQLQLRSQDQTVEGFESSPKHSDKEELSTHTHAHTSMSEARMKGESLSNLAHIASGREPIQPCEAHAAVQAVLTAQTCPSSSPLPSYAVDRCANIQGSAIVAMGAQLLIRNPALVEAIAATMLDVTKGMDDDFRRVDATKPTIDCIAAAVPEEPLMATCETSSGSWQELRAKFMCQLCLDVLAAPHITQCTHTYCGQCIETYTQQVMQAIEEDDDLECEPRCPICRSDITSTTYERCYDQIIAEAVKDMPDTADKRAWHERREKSLSKLESPKKRQPRVEEWDMLDILESPSTNVLLGIMALLVLVMAIQRTCLA